MLDTPFHGAPPLGFRFAVLFFTAGTIANPIDTQFQKVSGISTTLETTPVEDGGQNLYTQQLPKRLTHENLVLERGFVHNVAASPLALEIDAAMSQFIFTPANVLVTLLNHDAAPLSSWLFINAFPVKWSISDLDATSNTVVIETIELAYQRMQTIRL